LGGTSTALTIESTNGKVNIEDVVFDGQAISAVTSIGVVSIALTGAITGATAVSSGTLALTGAITSVTSISAASLALTGAITGATAVSAGSLASTAGITAATTIIASGDIKTTNMIHGASGFGIRGGVGFDNTRPSGNPETWTISHWHGQLEKTTPWTSNQFRNYVVAWSSPPETFVTATISVSHCGEEGENPYPLGVRVHTKATTQFQINVWNQGTSTLASKKFKVCYIIIWGTNS